MSSDDLVDGVRRIADDGEVLVRTVWTHLPSITGNPDFPPWTYRQHIADGFRATVEVDRCIDDLIRRLHPFLQSDPVRNDEGFDINFPGAGYSTKELARFELSFAVGSVEAERRMKLQEVRAAAEKRVWDTCRQEYVPQAHLDSYDDIGVRAVRRRWALVVSLVCGQRSFHRSVSFARH